MLRNINMHSSRFCHKTLLISILISLAPLSVIANLQTEYIGSDALDGDYKGILPLNEEAEYPDHVEQTYPIDYEYNSEKT